LKTANGIEINEVPVDVDGVDFVFKSVLERRCERRNVVVWYVNVGKKKDIIVINWKFIWAVLVLPLVW
jgi:hypothetical protein